MGIAWQTDAAGVQGSAWGWALLGLLPCVASLRRPLPFTYVDCRRAGVRDLLPDIDGFETCEA